MKTKHVLLSVASPRGFRVGGEKILMILIKKGGAPGREGASSLVVYKEFIKYD